MTEKNEFPNFEPSLTTITETKDKCLNFSESCIDKNCNHCHAQNYPKKQEGEGILYQHIKKEAKSITLTENGYFTDTDEKFGYLLDKDEMLKLLDEAKADFEKILKEEEAKHPSGFQVPRLRAYGIWYQKWFSNPTLAVANSFR